MKQLSLEIFGDEHYREILLALNPSDGLAKKFVAQAKNRHLIKHYQDIFK